MHANSARLVLVGMLMFGALVAELSAPEPPVEGVQVPPAAHQYVTGPATSR